MSDLQFAFIIGFLSATLILLVMVVKMYSHMKRMKKANQQLRFESDYYMTRFSVAMALLSPEEARRITFSARMKAVNDQHRRNMEFINND